jgi:hypothetical protein
MSWKGDLERRAAVDVPLDELAAHQHRRQQVAGYRLLGAGHRVDVEEAVEHRLAPERVHLRAVAAKLRVPMEAPAGPSGAELRLVRLSVGSDIREDVEVADVGEQRVVVRQLTVDFHLEDDAEAVTDIFAARPPAGRRALLEQLVAARGLDLEIDVGPGGQLEVDQRRQSGRRKGGGSVPDLELTLSVGRRLAQLVVLQPIAAERADDEAAEGLLRLQVANASADHPPPPAIEQRAPVARRDQVGPLREVVLLALPPVGLHRGEEEVRRAFELGARAGNAVEPDHDLEPSPRIVRQSDGEVAFVENARLGEQRRLPSLDLRSVDLREGPLR